MIATLDLYTLVHSLTKAEKNIFRRFTSKNSKGGKKSNYFRLFEAIQKQRHYDEKALKKKFSHEKFVSHFSWEKNLLFNRILRCLHLHDPEHSREQELEELIHQSEILYRKRMFGPMKKIISKAHTIADRLHHPLYKIRIYEKEHNRIWRIKQIQEIEDFQKNGKGKLHLHISEYLNLTHYRSATNEIQLIFLKEGEHPDNRRILAAMEPILQTEFFRNESAAIHPDSLYDFHQVNGLYYYLKGDLPRSFHHCLKKTELFGKTPGKTGILNYIHALRDMIVICLEMRKITSLFKYLRQLGEIKPGTLIERVRQFEISTRYTLTFRLLSGEPEKLSTLVPITEQGIERWKDKLTNVSWLLLQYQLSYYYFLTGNYVRSLERINAILNSGDTELRPDIHSEARILNLVIHYELGNRDLLEYLTRSVYRFLSKKARLTAMESIFLTFLRRDFSPMNNPRKIRDMFSKMQREISGTSEKERATGTDNTFDILSWLESKIKNIPMAAILKENFRKNLSPEEILQ